MNPVWLVRNIRNFWPTSASAGDFVQCLLWVYSPKLPHALRKPERTIGFEYPDPVGNIRLVLRDNAGSDAFIFGEVFGHQYYRLPLKAQPRTILDLGANTGMTAVYFGRVYPNAQVACVEPVPGNVRVLERNLALNSIRATVLAAAVDVRDGQVRMELLDKDYGHRVAGAGGTQGHETVEVPALSVPTMMRRLGWQRIGLLKVDIEGHEKVLFSSDCEWLGLVDSMCIECHEGFGESDLRSLAARFGFLEPVLLPGIWLLTRN
ncbi:MAG: FkbM family methyltransferase [Usitatibacter sp.]